MQKVSISVEVPNINISIYYVSRVKMVAGRGQVWEAKEKNDVSPKPDVQICKARGGHRMRSIPNPALEGVATGATRIGTEKQGGGQARSECCDPENKTKC
jgi:hypothetical protein